MTKIVPVRTFEGQVRGAVDTDLDRATQKEIDATGVKALAQLMAKNRQNFWGINQKSSGPNEVVARFSIEKPLPTHDFGKIDVPDTATYHLGPPKGPPTYGQQRVGWATVRVQLDPKTHQPLSLNVDDEDGNRVQVSAKFGQNGEIVSMTTRQQGCVENDGEVRSKLEKKNDFATDFTVDGFKVERD